MLCKPDGANNRGLSSKTRGAALHGNEPTIHGEYYAVNIRRCRLTARPWCRLTKCCLSLSGYVIFGIIVAKLGRSSWPGHLLASGVPHTLPTEAIQNRARSVHQIYTVCVLLTTCHCVYNERATGLHKFPQA